jgi:tetratricopeptide (TPR) repeat protein
MKRGLKEEALLALSNIAEMKLDNVELLRILGNKLIQLEYNDYAVDIFEHIVKIKGEDPQSYRDLALAYQAAKKYQKALDTFYKILAGSWDSRFKRLKQIIFVEMNNLISLHKVDVSKINKELIFKMPVDLRITLGWSSDSTDIDLHVKDPYGETAYYEHQLTATGGHMSDDITQGFGPEEFMIKKAVDGVYEIKTNNFSDSRQSVSGPTTLYLDIFTFYGTDKETKQRLLVRTDSVKQDNIIGSIDFKTAPDAPDGKKEEQPIGLKKMKAFFQQLKDK